MAVRYGTDITYNFFTITKPIGKFLYSEDDSVFVFECDFVPDFDTQEQDILALNARNADLLVTYMEKTLVNMGPLNNTAFDTRGTVTKKRDKSFGKKQVYTFRCVGTLPASRSIWEGASEFYKAGLKEFQVSKVYSLSRLESVIFTGNYTVLPEQLETAQENYDSESTGGIALAEDWLSNHFDGVNFIRTSESGKTSGQEKEFQFTIQYDFRTLSEPATGVIMKAFTMDQIIDLETYRGVQTEVVKPSQASGTTSEAGSGEIVDTPLGNDVPRYFAARAIFACDRNEYTTPESMRNVFYSNLINWTTDYIKETHQFGNFHISKSIDSIDSANWYIVADFLIIAYPTSNLIKYTVDERFDMNPNEIWKKISDGKHFTYKIWAAGGTIQKTVQIDLITLGGEAPESYFEAAVNKYLGIEGAATSKGWRIVNIGGTVMHRWRQEINKQPYGIYYKGRVYTMRYFESAEIAPLAVDIVDASLGRNLFS